MSYPPSSFNPFGYTRPRGYAAEPWMNQASQVTDAIACEDNGWLGLITGGASVTTITEQKGGVGAGLTGLSWTTGFASRDIGYVQFGTPGSGGNGSATFDAVAARFTGTAIPWTIFMTVWLKANTPGGGPVHYLLSFGNSASAQSFIGFTILTGGTQLVFQRRNNAGTLLTTPTAVTLGTAGPCVIVANYDGANISTRVNRTPVDTAFAFGGGALTTNRFTLGGLRLNGAASGFSNMSLDRCILAPASLNAQNQTLIEDFLCRRIGI